MKNIGMIALCALAVSACWGAPPDEKILAGLCNDVFTGDAEIVSEISRDGSVDLETYCACYSATIVADASKIDLHKTVSIAIADARDGTNLGTEDGAERVEDLIRSGDITEFTEDDLSRVGEDYQSVMRDLSNSGGVCPA